MARALRGIIWTLVLVFGLGAGPAAAAAASGAAEGKVQKPKKRKQRRKVSPVPRFSQAERRQLAQKKTVKRRFRIRRKGTLYHAGLSYRLVKAAPMEVIRVLRQPDGIVQAIPYGVEARTLWEKDGVSRVRIRQGKNPIIGKYTVQVRWDLANHQARFWMDPAYHHDVQDVWGVFSAREVQPGYTLICFGFAFDIGGVGELLENKAQGWALATADRIAKLVEAETALSAPTGG